MGEHKNGHPLPCFRAEESRASGPVLTCPKMMIATADAFDECFEAWKAEELVKFMELFLVVPMQEATSSDNTDREITPLSSSIQIML
ncbi:hypothetical protein AXG93_819s1000 [Marchantia polymorpha subsp. ruderalis]|uniref:Uncharacterized protein n=1 Tax=Marchantia polymorpha subsp. ruderalis TaxID=1480154 RepID=A0A176VGY2_MARPO|nr:hypothetical protein AXG93_819s1000 [Marchantia polymorpha subsp. ruderalis]